MRQLVALVGANWRPHFINWRLLFREIMNTRQFALTITSCVEKQRVDFDMIANLLDPLTIDATFQHDGDGPVPGMKTTDNEWELRGHASRRIHFDEQRLETLGSLYGDDDFEYHASRLPLVYCSELLGILEAVAGSSKRVNPWKVTPMIDESGGLRSGVILRGTSHPESEKSCILSGPHLDVSNPFARSANEECKDPKDYTAVDLVNITDEYFPRTVYRPGPVWAGVNAYLPGNLHGYPRVAVRTMVDPGAARTLLPVLLPSGVAHIDGVTSEYQDRNSLAYVCGLLSSIPYDYWMKATGKTHCREEVLKSFPLVDEFVGRREVELRCLRLNCITKCYSDIWERSNCEAFANDSFAGVDPRLGVLGKASGEWNRGVPLRSQLTRRQALVEVDVLTSMSLGITLDDLLVAYRVQFAVLQKNERAALYDQVGREVPRRSSIRGQQCLPLMELAKGLRAQAGFDIHAEYHPGGPNTQELRRRRIRLGKKEADVLGVSERCTMADLLAETEVRWSDEGHPEGRSLRLVGLRYTDPGLEPRMERVYPTPWTRCDREADYRQAWTEFERRLGKKMPEGSSL